MSQILDVISVKPQSDYTLELEFGNGETRIFDMSPYMDRKPFSNLKEGELFLQADVEYGTVVWPGEIDVSIELLYSKSVPAHQQSSRP